MKYTSKVKISDHLTEFFQFYIDPIIHKSPILEHRKIIRKSAKLNELLYDNNKGIVAYFDYGRKEFGENLMFTKDSAIKLIMDLVDQDNKQFIASEKIILEIFIYSMMTVTDEN